MVQSPSKLLADLSRENLPLRRIERFRLFHSHPSAEIPHVFDQSCLLVSEKTNARRALSDNDQELLNRPDHSVPRLSSLPDSIFAPNLRKQCGRLGRRPPQAAAASNSFVIGRPEQRAHPARWLPATPATLNGAPPHVRPPPPPSSADEGRFSDCPAPTGTPSFLRTAGSAWRKPGWPPETSECLAPGASQARQPAAATPSIQSNPNDAPRRRWLARCPKPGRGGGRRTFLYSSGKGASSFPGSPGVGDGCTYNSLFPTLSPHPPPSNPSPTLRTDARNAIIHHIPGGGISFSNPTP